MRVRVAHLLAAITLLVLVAAPVSLATYNILCSGGGVRAALGCGVAITLLKQQDPTMFQDVRNIKGISGGSWGIVMAGLADDGSKIRISARKLASKSYYGPGTNALRASKSFYNNWKSEIRKFFISPFRKSLKTLTQFTNAVATTHPGINFEILVAGVDHQNYGANQGWCAFATSSNRVNCYKSNAVDTVDWYNDASTQKLSQLMSLSSSAASSMKIPKVARKFPRFDLGTGTPNTGVPFKYLVDAGHFNNLPFFPVTNDDKIISFDYTKSNNPLVCYERFKAWAHTNAPQHEIDGDFIFVLPDGTMHSQPFTVPHNPNAILFVFRTLGATHRKYYYNYPFIGKTKGFQLIRSFPTLTTTKQALTYGRSKVDLYLDEYFEGLLQNLRVVLNVIKANPATLPWPVRPPPTTTTTPTLTDSDVSDYYDTLLDFASNSTAIEDLDGYSDEDEDPIDPADDPDILVLLQNNID